MNEKDKVNDTKATGFESVLYTDNLNKTKGF